MSSPTRRLVAIFFSDIVGYTKMMGEDQLSALDVLRQSREIQKQAIEQHGGKWLKEMGDGVLAQFDTAYDSINAALEIQKNASEQLSAKIRIGIHLGDVTIENDDVFGDGVNIASRLQAIADPGGIYISESVHQAIRAYPEINTIFLGKVALKNVGDKLNTYYLSEEWLPIPDNHKIRQLEANSSRTKIYIMVSFVLAVLIASAFWISSIFNQGNTTSIAVLPVGNLSGDPSIDVFLSGVHSELRNEVAKVGALRVVSRRSASKYQNMNMTLSEIAEELNVDLIVEPDISKFDDSIAIEFRLIKVSKQEDEIWNQAYFSPIQNITSIYNDVALAIAENLDLNVTSEEIASIRSGKEIDPEAYEAYLAGINFLYTATKPALEKALEYFTKAVELDPDFAEAKLGIANAWAFQSQMGYISYAVAYPNLNKALEEALALDSTSVDSHYTLAIHSTWSLWEWETAEAEFKKTLELDPNNVEALAYYAHYLNIMSRSKEAEIYMEKAMELEPYNTMLIGLYGMYLNHTRQFDKAKSLLQKTLEKESNPLASPALWTIYHNTQNYEDAVKVAQEVYSAKREYVIVEKLIKGYNDGGYEVAMNRIAEAFLTKRDTSFFPAWQLATLYTRANNQDKAMDWLEEAYKEHDVNMPYISCDPIFDNLENNDRFIVLLDIMNLKRN